MVDAERWAAGIAMPAYVIDVQTAINKVDGSVDLVSKGHWELFTTL
jgi:dipeptidase E